MTECEITTLTGHYASIRSADAWGANNAALAEQSGSSTIDRSLNMHCSKPSFNNAQQHSICNDN